MSDSATGRAGWFCGGCGKPVDGAMASDKNDRWCSSCGAAYRTNFGRINA